MSGARRGGALTRRELARGAGFLVLVFAAAAAGVWAGGAFRDGRAAQPAAVDSDLEPGAVFPTETVVDAAGGRHDLAELAADGAVVMFLTADCPACGMTLEHWRPAIEAGALTGVPILGVTADPAERLEDFRTKGARFPVYRDPEQRFNRRHGVTEVPFVVVVGPGGEIRERWVGHRGDVDFARIRRLVDG